MCSGRLQCAVYLRVCASPRAPLLSRQIAPPFLWKPSPPTTTWRRPPETHRASTNNRYPFEHPFRTPFWCAPLSLDLACTCYFRLPSVRRSAVNMPRPPSVRRVSPRVCVAMSPRFFKQTKSPLLLLPPLPLETESPHHHLAATSRDSTSATPSNSRYPFEHPRIVAGTGRAAPGPLRPALGTQPPPYSERKSLVAYRTIADSCRQTPINRSPPLAARLPLIFS